MYRCKECGAGFVAPDRLSASSLMWPEVRWVCPECGRDASDAEYGDACERCGGFVPRSSGAHVCDDCLASRLSVRLVAKYLDERGEVDMVPLNPVLSAAFDAIEIDRILGDYLAGLIERSVITEAGAVSIMREALNSDEDGYLRWLEKPKRAGAIK